MEGYVVREWYSNVSLKNKFEFNNAINANTTLYGESEYFVKMLLSLKFAKKFNISLQAKTLSIFSIDELTSYFLYVQLFNVLEEENAFFPFFLLKRLTFRYIRYIITGVTQLVLRIVCQGEKEMPPKVKFTKEQIIQTAVCIARESGYEELSARKLSAKLGTSTKPIFGLFKNMEEVRFEVIKSAYALYNEYIYNYMQSSGCPPYKASGMAYIKFASEEREIFKLLFMRDRTKESFGKGLDADGILDIIRKNTGLDRESAEKLHIANWIFVHGIATMIVTGYLEWKDEDISEMLTLEYVSVRDKFLKQKGIKKEE